MDCTGCIYLSWVEPKNQDGDVQAVMYVCVHPQARGEKRASHGARGFMIEEVVLPKKEFFSRVGKVEQPIWCPIDE